MNKKRLMFLVKLAILAGILWFVGKTVWTAWENGAAAAKKANIALGWGSIDWRFGIVAIVGFCGVMLTSGTTWRWLAGRMGDRSPVARMIGAYTFSQMGKYIPGKVALLLMRIERAGRYGMMPAVCTLSTLLENALYMISGGLVGMFAIASVVGELPVKIRPFVWPVMIVAVAELVVACQPRVFYGVVGALLKRMKKPPVSEEQRLTGVTLALGVLRFVPCWVFGGIALWGSMCCVQWVPLRECLWFAGAFSLSVIIGMASPLPGGTGIREAVLGAAVGLQLAPMLGHNRAILIGTVVAVLQRVFQLVAELILGLAGAAATRRPAGSGLTPEVPSIEGK